MRIERFIVGLLLVIGFLFIPGKIAWADCQGCQVVKGTCEGPEGPYECWVDGCSGSCEESTCGPCQYACGSGDCCDVDAACQGEDDTNGGIGRGGCVAPQNVNCPANSACTPEGNRLCNTYNINYNSATQTTFDGPDGNATCQLGNAQASEHGCNAWFCGYNVTTFDCCPAGSVSRWWYVQPANTTHSVNQCDYESTTNCWPGTFVSWVPTYQCGISPKDEEGNREPLYVGIKTCKPERVKAYSCDSICSGTAPSNIAYDSGTQQVSWTPGAGSTSQTLYISPVEADVHNGCGAATCLVRTTFNNGTTSTYNISATLQSATRYYVGIFAFESQSCIKAAYGYFDTPALNAGAWWQVADGDGLKLQHHKILCQRNFTLKRI